MARDDLKDARSHGLVCRQRVGRLICKKSFQCCLVHYWMVRNNRRHPEEKIVRGGLRLLSRPSRPHG
jgi:hypothetical protein